MSSANGASCPSFLLAGKVAWYAHCTQQHDRNENACRVRHTGVGRPPNMEGSRRYGTSMAGAVMSTTLCLGPKRFFWRVIADSRARHFPRTTCASVSNHQRRFQNQRNKRWAATPPVRWAQRRRTPTCRRSRRKPRSALSTQPGPPLCHQETATRPPSAAVPSSTNKPVGS